jgi:3-oxoacyl-ACP reductase-like protein
VRAAPQPSRVATQPSLKPSTVAPQAVSASASPPASTPAIAAPASGAPAAAPAANSALVLEELRAIHAEIDARKRHVDSLTASLDSLKRGTTPE